MKPKLLSEQIATRKERQKLLAECGKFEPPKTKLLLSIPHNNSANVVGSGSSTGQFNRFAWRDAAQR